MNEDKAHSSLASSIAREIVHPFHGLRCICIEVQVHRIVEAVDQ